MVLQILQTIGAVSLVYCVGEGLRRLYAHPLSHIPGPKLAALTWWYEFYFDVIQPGRFVFKIQELHQKYGPIIRITPDEVHINDVGFVDTVYAPSGARRDKYDYQLRALNMPGGVGTTASHEIHRKRREALAPFFSRRNVVHLEPLIREKVEQLCQLVAGHAKEKTPVNLSDLFWGFSNDVTNNFLFAHHSNILADEAKAATSRQNSNQLLLGIHVNKHFPWLPRFMESLPLAISKPLMPPGLLDMLELFDRVRNELVGLMQSKQDSAPTDQGSLGPTGKTSVYDSVLDSKVLPPEEKSLRRLQEEGALLVLAGTDSPAKSLSVIFYHLLANPEIMKRLRTELETLATPDPAWTELEKLPYLSAVIEEGNRLSFGVTARMARISAQYEIYVPSPYANPLPQVSITVEQRNHWALPAGTPMSISTLSAHTNPTIFPNPFAFNPDRWLEDKSLKNHQMAFSKGGRKCLGIELANAELYLVVAALVTKFDKLELYETDEDVVSFVGDFQVAMPKDPRGVRALVG